MRARTISPLLFCSGAASLALEVAWFRRMAQVAGGTSVAMAAVLAAVIGGMALGAFLFGRTADRARFPLRLYGLLEVGVATAALLSPLLLETAVDLFTMLQRALEGSPALLAAARFGSAALLLALPAILMGGTLPAAAAALRAPPEDRGRAIGWLYAANTFGAVAGTLAAGFLLLPALGLADTMRLAAGLSGLAGMVALFVRTEAARGAIADAPAPGARGAILLYAASGFLGLAAEVAFTRGLVLVFGSTTYAFSAMLAVFLFGIGAGGALGTRVRQNHRRHLETTVAVTAALFALAGPLLYYLPRLYLEGVVAVGFGFHAGLWLRVALAALVLLPGALGLGFAFPLAAHVASAGSVGAGTGRLYAANTFASIAGSTIAVFVLVPAFGPHYAVAGVAAAVALGCALAARRRVVWAVTAVVMLGFWPPAPAARERLLSGVYFNPWAYLTAGEIDEEKWEDGVDLSFARYGRDATVAIWRWWGRESLLIDGKAVASDHVLADVHHLSLLGHLPMAVHPAPRRVLVVGLGLGTTYRAVASHSPRLLRVVEMEEAVVEAASFLGLDPADVVIADARTYLRATDETFDVITCDPIHPWVRGGGDLYTKEYLESCRARLAPGGVACLWLPVYQMGLDNVRAVLRTFAAVFRTHAYYGGGDLVLVGMDGAPPPDPRPVTLPPVLDHNLTRLRVARHDRALEAAGSGRLLTDDALRLEFSAPRFIDNSDMPRSFDWIMRTWQSPPEPYAAILAAERALAAGDGAAASHALRQALTQAPKDAFVAHRVGEKDLFLADEALQAGEYETAASDLRRARKRLGDDPRLVGLEADLAAASGDRETARRLYRSLGERYGRSAYLARRLARVE